MKFSWKGIGIAVGALVGVIAIAAALFVVFFPKELAAREAEHRIEAATNRDLQLGGKIELTFWPALGFSVEQVSLSNPHNFDTPASRGGAAAAATPFMTARRIVFAVAVVPLLRGEIQVKRLILEGADLRLRAKEDGRANWTFPTEDNSNQQTTLEDLRLEDMRFVDSAVSFQGADGQPPLTLAHVDASLALASLDAPATVHSAFDYRGRRLRVDADIAKPRAVIEKGETPFRTQVDGDLIDATFDGAFNAATGALTGQLAANGTSLRDVLAWMGSPMAAGGGFGPYRLQAAMAHQDQQTALTNATIQLDAINARGNLTLISQENSRIRVTGALSTGALDLNPYLPAPAQGGQAGGVEVDTGWSNDRLDLSGLRALDADLNLTMSGLKFQKLSFGAVAMNLRVANGAADARLTRIAAYGGAGTGRMIADGSTATPRIAVEFNVNNVQAEPLLQDALGFDKITGRGRVVLSIFGTGGTQAALMRSLRGSASFAFNDGQWKGVNLAQVARVVQSTLTGSEVGAGGGSTDFSEMGANFQITGGVAATDNLHFLSPYLRLDGMGVINIGAQTIDMRLSPRAVRSAQGQGGDAAVQGFGIPFRVNGPWSHPAFRPALDDVVENQLRSRAQDILRHQDSGNALTQLGESLFGTQAAAPAQAPAAQTPAPAQPAPAQQQPAQQSSDPLQDALRRAVERNTRRSSEKQSPPPAEPAPTP